MSDAISPAPGVSGAPNGPVKRRGGGNLSQMFPNGFKIWLDNDLLFALERVRGVERPAHQPLRAIGCARRQLLLGFTWKPNDGAPSL
jgi:hypothetical protein